MTLRSLQFPLPPGTTLVFNQQTLQWEAFSPAALAARNFASAQRRIVIADEKEQRQRSDERMTALAKADEEWTGRLERLRKTREKKHRQREQHISAGCPCRHRRSKTIQVESIIGWPAEAVEPAEYLGPRVPDLEDPLDSDEWFEFIASGGHFMRAA